MLNSFVVENNGGKINGENYGNNIGDLWGGGRWCGVRSGVNVHGVRVAWHGLAQFSHSLPG